MPRKKPKTETPRQLDRLMALSSPAGFAKATSHGAWKMARHLAILNRALVDVEQRRIRRLIVQVASRHGKSELICENFVAWYLGLHPEHGIMLGGYNAKFTRKFGRAARNKLDRYGEAVFGEGIRVDPRSSSAEEWDILGHRGGFFATSVQTGGTGRGGDILIVDDPFANSREANSETYRNIVDEDFYRKTFRNRLAPNGCIIIVMSRWHEDDLIGRLLKRQKEGVPDAEGDDADEIEMHPWHVIDLPALALADGSDGPLGPGTYHDALGRKEGEALWAERYPRNELLSLRREMGSPGFQANMQQRPMPPSGGMFDRSWFRYYAFRPDPKVGGFFLILGGDERIPLAGCEVFQIVDLAISEKKTAAYTAIGTFAWHRPTSYMFVLHMWRAHIDPLKQIKAIENLYLRFKPDVIGVEAVNYQASAVLHVRAKGIPVIALDPGKDDKITRAIPIAARIEGGTVFFPQVAPWREALEDELVVFPKAGVQKDQVDVMAYAGLRVIEQATAQAPAGTHRPARR